MKKPKKKEVPECLNDLTVGDYEEGFNEAYDEWEEYHNYMLNLALKAGETVGRAIHGGIHGKRTSR